jgi:glucosyl-dolichyl phosphate glucuronosyltransferase
VQPDAVSVIVPTFRRPVDVERCLAGLAGQDVSGFEVVVVDNASDPALRELVGSKPAGAARAIRYLSEATLGVHNARHAGARAAGGCLLLFTDDDAECSPGWVRAYVDAFAEPSIAAAGGPVRPRFEREPPDWIAELVAQRDRFEPYSLMEPDPTAVRSDRGFFYSINMAIRREILFALGGFNPEAFGRIWLGDGESGLNRKLWRESLTVAYVPEAVVWHRIPAERLTLAYLQRRARNQGAADAYTLLHPFDFRRRGLLALVVRTVLAAARTLVPALPSFRRRDPPSVRRRLAAFTALGGLEFYARLLVRPGLWPLVKRQRWL